jgi:hypothetical protein
LTGRSNPPCDPEALRALDLFDTVEEAEIAAKQLRLKVDGVRP